jgi:hypothetical protein
MLALIVIPAFPRLVGIEVVKTGYFTGAES